jgi:hypothetical protein
MSIDVSWWLLALVVGAAAPLWVRVIVNRWERRAQVRTERIAAQFEREGSVVVEAERDLSKD